MLKDDVRLKRSGKGVRTSRVSSERLSTDDSSPDMQSESGVQISRVIEFVRSLREESLVFFDQGKILSRRMA